MQNILFVENYYMQPNNFLYACRLKLNSYAKMFILNSCLLSIVLHMKQRN